MELQIFTNDEFGQVRSLMKDGEPWFVGKDVATALGYKNPNDAMKKRINDEDKGVANCDTLGGTQNIVIINESGLYALVFGSKLESAQNFKRWVTKEVLPTIRKTGGFVNNDELFINTYLPFADETTKSMFRSTLGVVRKQNEIIEQQKLEIEDKNNKLELDQEIIDGLVENLPVANQRQVINKILDSNTPKKRQERYKMLYKEFGRLHHMNINARLNNYNKKYGTKLNKLDYIEKLDKMQDLYNLSVKLFREDIKKLITQMYYLRKED